MRSSTDVLQEVKRKNVGRGVGFPFPDISTSKSNPAQDLENVLAGHHAFSDTTSTASRAVDDTLSALPYVDMGMRVTSATGRYLQQAEETTTDRLDDRLGKLDATLVPRANALNIEDHAQVANLIADIKSKKKAANPKLNQNTHASEVDLLLQSLILKRKQTFDLTHRVNQDDAPVIKQQKIKAFNAEFKKEMDEHLEAIQTKLQDKPEGLRIKRPEKFQACVKYLNDINEAAAKMTGDFDAAKSEVLAQINATCVALQSASDPQIYQAQFEKLENELKAKITVYEEETGTTDEQVAALKWATKHALAEKLQALNPTPENESALNASLTTRPANYDSLKENITPKLNDAKSLINNMAATKAKQQKVEAIAKRAADNPNSPEGKLKECREDQDARLQAIKKRLEDTKNPHPSLLKNFQANLYQANHDYRHDVRKVHKNVGTLKLLDSISAPLNILRGKTRDQAAQLPQLDTDLQDTKNQGLIGLHNKVAAVNELLQQREKMEATLASNPSLANSMRKEISDNTRRLSSSMEQLAQTMESLHSDAKGTMPSLLAAIPNIEAFSNKASALYDSLNRSFFKRKKVPGILRFNPLLNRLAKNYKLPIPKVKYDPTAEAKGNNTYETSYFEQDSRGRWFEKTLKLTGDFLTNEKGERIKDKNDKDIPLTDEDRNISFSGKELANLYAEFCQAQQLNSANGNAPKMKQTGPNEFTIKWASRDDKKAWIQFLRSRHQQKLKEKADNPTPKVEHEASVGIRNDESSSSSAFAAHPGAPSGASSGPGASA